MDLSLLFPLIILLLFIPIFLNGRKQKRQMQQMQQLQTSLSEGDVVVTTSGLRGTVVDSTYEETVDLEIAPGVVTTWIRAAVREKVETKSSTGTDNADGTDGADSTDSADRAGTDRIGTDGASAGEAPAVPVTASNEAEADTSANGTAGGRTGA
jgi:preprotein translocase subunit YajC